jgi:hypothetical protein
MPTLQAAYVETLGSAPLQRALASLLGDTAAPPDLLLAFVAEADAAGIPELQASCRDRGLPLAGALFPALVGHEGFLDHGVWLVVVPGARRVFLDALPEDTDAAADLISAGAAPHLADEPPILFSVFDACTPNVASILEALYLRLSDGVRYLGACAGSESFQPVPCLFDERRFFGGGALCVLLPREMRSALSHGYGVPDDDLTATATAGNRIRSINWSNAFEVYRDRVHRAGFAIDRTNFYQHAVHFPFGLLLGNGRAVVRIPVSLADDGTIAFAGEVPNSALLGMLTPPAAGSPETVAYIREALGAAPAGAPLLTFYCAGRRLHLGDAAAAEVRALGGATGEALVGALSLGEIGSFEGSSYPYFHNGAVLCTALRP